FCSFAVSLRFRSYSAGSFSRPLITLMPEPPSLRVSRHGSSLSKTSVANFVHHRSSFFSAGSRAAAVPCRRRALPIERDRRRVADDSVMFEWDSHAREDGG